MSAGGGRTPYRPEAADKLDRIERRRQTIGVSRAELAVRAGIGLNTYDRAIRDKRCKRGTLATLTLALRELEKERAREGRLLRSEAP